MVRWLCGLFCLFTPLPERNYKKLCSSRTRYRRRKRLQATAAQKLTNRFPSADPTTLAFQIGHGSRPRNMSLSDKQTKAVIEG